MTEGGDGTPVVTVVIPSYNRWPMVTEAVESALGQEGTALVEVVVVDDGSTDGTAERLIDRYPSVHVIRQENAERGAARNRGADAANGAYLSFLDSDDVLEPWHVSEFMNLLERCRECNAPIPFVAAAPAVRWNPVTRRRQRVEPRGLHRRLPLPEAALLGTVFPLQGLFVRGAAFAASGGFPTDRRIATNEDWVFLARLACRFPISQLERTSVRIRDHPGRSMADVEQACSSRLAAMEFVLSHGVQRQPLEEQQERLVVAGAHHFCAAMSYQGGAMSQARYHLRLAASAIGWHRAVGLCSRLWVLSCLGRRGSLVLRRARTTVMRNR